MFAREKLNIGCASHYNNHKYSYDIGNELQVRSRFGCERLREINGSEISTWHAWTTQPNLIVFYDSIRLEDRA